MPRFINVFDSTVHLSSEHHQEEIKSSEKQEFLSITRQSIIIAIGTTDAMGHKQ